MAVPRFPVAQVRERLPRVGRRSALGLASLISACSPAAGPAPSPAPPFTLPRAPTPCVYGLAAPEVSLTPDVADPFQSDVGWAAGRLLVAYTTYDERDGYAIRARVYDPATGKLSVPVRLSPRGGHVVPRVRGVGDRFLVTWEKQSRPDSPGEEGPWGRWITPDLQMSPARRLPSGAGTDRIDPPKDDPFATAPAPMGGTWIASLGKATTGDEREVVELRLTDDTGQDLAAPIPVSGPEARYVGSPALLTVPEGLLVAWAETSAAPEGAGRAGVWLRPLDARGEPLGPPRQIEEARGEEYATVQLFAAAGGPVLVWGRQAKALALSWRGEPLAPASTLAPLGQRGVGAGQKWIGPPGDPWVVFTDVRHARTERFAARVRCGGAVPALTPAVPVVDRRAAKPPPAVSAAPEMRCPRLSRDLDVDLGEAVGEAPRLAAGGGELWTAWRVATGEGRREMQARWRGLRLADGRLLDPQQGPAAEHLSLARGERLAVLVEGPRGRPTAVEEIAPGGARRVSDPLAEGHAPEVVASGAELGVFWTEGEHTEHRGFLQFRSLGKDAYAPPVPISFPEMGGCCHHAAPAPGGFAVAWTAPRLAPVPGARDGHALRVARVVGGRAVWATPPRGLDVWGYDAVKAVGAAGGQILAVVLTGRSGRHSASLLRWDLDGARLDDVPLPFDGLLAAAVDEAGILAVTYEDGKPPRRCVHRLGFDGAALGPKACAPTRIEVRSDAVLRAGGAIFHATHAEDDFHARLSRLRCKG